MKSLLLLFIGLPQVALASGHEAPQHDEPIHHQEPAKSVVVAKPSVAPLPPQEHPTHCLKKKTYPCAVWGIGKGQIKHQGAEVYFSAGSLFEWKDARTIYLSSGWLWVMNEKEITVRGRYGQVYTPSKNEILVNAADDAFTVRAGLKPLSVRPLGGQDEMLLDKGYEIRFTYVDRSFGTAEFTWPVVMNFASYLSGIQKTSGEEQVRQKAQELASVIVTAAQKSAMSQELALRRNLASVSQGPKESEAEDPGRDLRLRRLFQIKSDFEE